MFRRRILLLGALGIGLTTGAGYYASNVANASDHDDGESDLKGRAVNLTDLYVFREDNQNGVGADNDQLILIMNSNPRSVAGQQYYFSDKARYEFHVTRVGDNSAIPTGADDVILRFTFGAPDANKQQAITLTTIKGGTETAATGALLTTALPGTTEVVNTATVGGDTLSVFAGLREDPFFFDVTSFFQTRATGMVALKGSNDAVDFTAGYNVNSIVARVPIAFLQSAGETNFDVWTTISYPGI